MRAARWNLANRPLAFVKYKKIGNVLILDIRIS